MANKILLIGPSGGGKSTLICDAIRWGKMEVLDADNKFDIALSKAPDDLRAAFAANKSMIHRITNVEQIVKVVMGIKPETKTLVIDTYSALTGIIMTFLVSDGKTDLDAIINNTAKDNQGEYQRLKNILNAIFSSIKTLPQNVIISAHVAEQLRPLQQTQTHDVFKGDKSLTNAPKIIKQNQAGTMLFDSYIPDGEGRHKESLRAFAADLYYITMHKLTNTPTAYARPDYVYGTKNSLPVENDALTSEGFLREFSLSHLDHLAYK